MSLKEHRPNKNQKFCLTLVPMMGVKSGPNHFITFKTLVYYIIMRSKIHVIYCIDILYFTQIYVNK